MSDEKPTFDFGRVSRQWNRQFARTIQDATGITIDLQRPPPEKATPAEMNAHLDRVNAAMNRLEDIANQQSELIAQVLVGVPRGWLLKDAPEEIDWSEADNLDWLRADCYQKLVAMVQSGEAMQEASKN